MFEEFGIRNYIFLLVFGAAGALFAVRLGTMYRYLRFAKKDDRFSNIGQRLKQVLTVGIAQKKILRDKKAGPIHAMIFWGFLILLFSALNTLFAGFGIHHVFDLLGPIYSAITILTDIFILLIIVGVLAALWRRYVSPVARLKRKGKMSTEAGLILVTIFFIVTSLLFENASLHGMNQDADWAVRPLAAALGGVLPTDALPLIFEIAWWMHLVLILAFMNVLPYSKHFHVITSLPNVFFSNYKPTNALEPIDFEDETVEAFGVSDIEDFSWKTLHDGYTCTECGRCTSVCPANQTGKILDPREIIIQIRKRTVDKAPILEKIDKEVKAGKDKEGIVLTEEEQAIMDKKLVGDYVSPEALWQCTTCSACMEECPVNIEHVPAIVGMRRSLVMMEADFPGELQVAFSNVENNASPWAFPQEARADWTEGTNVKEAAEKPDFDVLFWVGCAGSFDDNAKRTTLAFAKLLEHAGVNFAILGKEESCSGDPARRGGNEYLADMYVKMNVEAMNSYNVSKIVATCPHCFNTLKNEYGDFGGKYEVIHHTQFIEQLMAEGKININSEAKRHLNIAYHDSCYIGRLNGEYEAPRKVIENLPGLKVIEPKRRKSRGFCCGAGGARMFMEETEGKMVNIERTEELLASNPDQIAVNCPFCFTMMNDGVKNKQGDEQTVQVRDIAELVAENLE
ncbi:MAG: (Fe-S)-binding protein [Candidatus Kapaibacteriales bacterium]